MYSNEIQNKLGRLGGWLSQNNLDGVLLSKRANFAWITGGKDNHIASTSEVGVASILATPEKLICLTNHIESPRFRNEELAGLGIEVVDFPWWHQEEAQMTVNEVIAGRRVASDTGSFGLPGLPGGFAELRFSLSDVEIQRYRYCGQLAAAALESVCHQIQPGDSEFDIAARMEFEVQRTGAAPVVVLVSTDQRVYDYRHPIPTSKKLQKYAMLVICAEYRGLIANCTRFVHFGAMSSELKAKQQAVCNVDTAVNLATKVGRGLNEIFADLQQAYADNGWPEQWKLHHQGGSTGYAGRDEFGTPFSTSKVLPNQAFAWNPSIAGTKCEDTILVTDGGIEFITRPGEAWPKVIGKCAAGELPRADILVR